MKTEIRNSALLTAGTGTTAALSIVYAVYVGRKLGPADYADFAAAISLVAIFSLALGPINGTVARFAAKFVSQGKIGKIRMIDREIGRRIIRYGLIVVALGLLISAPLKSLLHFHSTIPVMIVFVMVYFNLLLNVSRGVLRGVQSFGQYNLNTISESLIRLCVGLLLLHIACSVISGLAAYVIALAIAWTMSRVQVQKHWKGHEPESVDGAEIRRFTIPMLLTAICAAGFQNVDMLIVKHHFERVAAGQYGAVFTLARSMGTLVTPFGILLLPLITNLHDKSQRTGGTITRICGYFLLLSAGPLLLFWIWPEKIMVVYGEEFIEASPLLLPLAAARMIGCLSGLIAVAHAAKNDFRYLLAIVPTLALEAVALAIWYDSLMSVVMVVAASQFVRLAAVLTLTIWSSDGPKKPADEKTSSLC